MKNKFTKADLKDGMIVELRNGKRFLKLGDCFRNLHEYEPLGYYLDDLTYYKNKNYSVLNVFEVFNSSSSLNGVLREDEELNIIWQRTETKRMTTEEMRQKLEELTGEKIEVELNRNDMIATCYRFCESRDDGCWGCRFEDSYHGCRFSKLPDKEIKECYEKVMEDGRAKSNSSNVERR